MEVLKRICLLFFVAVLVASCSNDFELTDDWKDIPIVYGLLSPVDSVNYIRVEKAFLDPNTSALEIAQRPDSLYYENITVQISHDKSDQVFELIRVDGNTIGLEREGGVFAQAPNYLYQLVLPPGELLVGGDYYKLNINRGDNKEDIVAETRILREIRIEKPKNPVSIDWLYGENESELEVDWIFTEEVALFDLKIQFNYKEYPNNQPQEAVEKQLVWLVDKSIKPKSDGSTVIRNDLPAGLFYQFLGSNIAVDPGMTRIFQNFDIKVIGGGAEILEYIEVGLAATGITSSQIITSYSNLSDGLGIFSSITHSSVKGNTLRPESRDTLRDGIYTRDLNFQ